MTHGAICNCTCCVFARASVGSTPESDRESQRVMTTAWLEVGATRPLIAAIKDLSNAAVSLGNHVGRTPVAAVSDWGERLDYASREAERLAVEFRALASDARDLARRAAR